MGKLGLSIIIVSFNVRELLANCLNSIWKKGKKCRFEVIVVDNNSSDGSGQMVREKFPQAQLIVLEKNLGFGRANNLGARKAREDILLFLNPDTEICPGSLAKIVEFLKAHPKAGIVGPQLLNSDGSFQPSVGNFPSISTLLWEKPVDFLERRIDLLRPFLGVFSVKYKRFARPVKVDWVSGAVLACRRKAFEQLGGFDEHFFLYFEDVDLCLRVKKSGWEVWYLPASRVYHLRGRSQLSASRKKAKIYYQSQDYFFQKHRGRFYAFLVKLIRLPYQFLNLRTKIGRYF